MKNRYLFKRFTAAALIPAILSLSLAGCGKSNETEKVISEDLIISNDDSGNSSQAETKQTEAAAETNTEITENADETLSKETANSSKADRSREVILVPDKIMASSELAAYPMQSDPSKWFTYYPTHIDDRNLDTAWNEGADGNGVGEYVELYYPEGTEITGGLFFPGYYKNEEIFFQNNAITRVEISSGNQKIEMDTSRFANSYTEDYSEKEFTLDEPLICDGKVRVTILDVREGTTYNDACISELQFRGYATDDTQSENAGDAHYNYMHEADMFQSSDLGCEILNQLEGLKSFDLDASFSLSMDTPEYRAYIILYFIYIKGGQYFNHDGFGFVCDRARIEEFYQSMFGECNEEDLDTFYDLYVEDSNGADSWFVACDRYFSMSSGMAPGVVNFGDFVFDSPECCGMIDGRMKIVGNVVGMDKYKQIVPLYRFIIWLLPCDISFFGGFVVVGIEIRELGDPEAMGSNPHSYPWEPLNLSEEVKDLVDQSNDWYQDSLGDMFEYFVKSDIYARSPQRIGFMMVEGGANVSFAENVQDADMPDGMPSVNARYYIDDDNDGAFDYTLYVDCSEPPVLDSQATAYIRRYE